jgi:hypothetical protein
MKSDAKFQAFRVTEDISATSGDIILTNGDDLIAVISPDSFKLFFESLPEIAKIELLSSTPAQISKPAEKDLDLSEIPTAQPAIDISVSKARAMAEWSVSADFRNLRATARANTVRAWLITTLYAYFQDSHDMKALNSSEISALMGLNGLKYDNMSARLLDLVRDGILARSQLITKHGGQSITQWVYSMTRLGEILAGKIIAIHRAYPDADVREAKAEQGFGQQPDQFRITKNAHSMNGYA